MSTNHCSPYWRAALAACSLAASHVVLFPQSPVAAEDTPAPSPAQSAPAGSPAQDEANSSPRERGRILQKRNPIASEYQIFGELGSSPGADADGEGVDYRAFFPRRDLFHSQDSSLEIEYNLNYNGLSGQAESGGGLSFHRILGSESKWALAFQLRSSASDRQIEHFEAVWQDGARLDYAPGALPQGAAEPSLFYLDRPRYSVDEIYTRNNVYAAQIAHRLSKRHSLYFKTYYQDYFDNFYRNRLELQIGAGQLADTPQTRVESGVLAAGSFLGARTRRYFGDTDNERARQHHQLGGTFEGSVWSIDYSIYLHKWDLDSLWYNWNFNDFGLDVAYQIDDPNLPAYAVAGRPDLTDQSQARFSSLRLHDSFTRDEDFAWRADAERRLRLAHRDFWIQLGALHREKERKSGEERDVFQADPANPFYLDAIERQVPSDRIIEDAYLHQPGLDPAAGADLLASRPELFPRNDFRSLVESAPDYYSAQESVTSGYALALTELASWTVELGGRVERTETETLGTVVIPERVDDPGEGTLLERVQNPANGEFELIKEIPAANAYTDFLPSFELSYALNDNAAIRAAWFKSIMRPQYFDIVNYRRISIPTRSISEGNPSLRPTFIDKFRIAFIQDLPAWGNLSLEAYAIEIEDFFYGAVSNELILEDGQPTQYTVSRVENGESGQIRGFEFQWQKKLGETFLWQDASASLAYTFSDSEASVETRPQDILWVPGRSEHLLEARWSSQSGPVQTGLSFKYQSEAIDDLGDRSEEDEYREKVLSLTLNNTCRLNEKTEVYLNLYNLINHPERAYEAIPLKKRRNQYSDWFAVFGFKRAY